jgi:hypothetical protein
VNEADRPWTERIAFKMWRWANSGAGRFAFLGSAGRLALRAAYAMKLGNTFFDPLRPWTKERAAPPIPRKSFRAIWRGDLGNN